MASSRGKASEATIEMGRAVTGTWTMLRPSWSKAKGKRKVKKGKLTAAETTPADPTTEIPSTESPSPPQESESDTASPDLRGRGAFRAAAVASVPSCMTCGAPAVYAVDAKLVQVPVCAVCYKLGAAAISLLQRFT